VPLDAVIADFMAGAVEYLTPDNDADHWDHIEGQGSLFHVSYHGGQPDAIVLAHEPTRTHMRGLPEYDLPSLEALRDMVLPIARVANPDVKIVGISINTQKLDEDAAIAYVAEVEDRRRFFAKNRGASPRFAPPPFRNTKEARALWIFRSRGMCFNWRRCLPSVVDRARKQRC